MGNVITFSNREYGTLRAILSDDKVYVCVTDLKKCIGLSPITNITKYLNKDLMIRARCSGDKNKGYNYIEEMNIMQLCFSLRNDDVAQRLKKIKKNWIDKEIRNTLIAGEKQSKIDSEIEQLWDELIQDCAEKYEDKKIEDLLAGSKCNVQGNTVVIRVQNTTTDEVGNSDLNDVSKTISNWIEEVYNIKYNVKFILPKIPATTQKLDIEKLTNELLAERGYRINAIYSDEIRNMIYIGVKVILRKPSIMCIQNGDKEKVMEIITNILDFVYSRRK